MIRTSVLVDPEALDEALAAMNERGEMPALPFIDADGTASVAWGQAPSGDDWQVGFPMQNADSGTQHCCWCSHEGSACDAGSDWQPSFPITAMASVSPFPD